MGKTNESINKKLNGKTLEEIRVIIETLNRAVCEAEKVEDRNKIENELDATIGYYNNAQKTRVYTECKRAKNPMAKAVEVFWVPQIRIKTSVDKKQEIPVIIRTVAEGKKAIDLLDFDKWADGIGADTKWKFSIQRFNRFMTTDVALGIGAEVDMDNFHMADAAKQIALGKTPMSKTQSIKTIQGIVDQMLGDYLNDPDYPKAFKVNQYDVRYIKEAYTSKDKKSIGGLNAANHKALTAIFMDIANRVLTGRIGYSLKQKEIKNPKK